MPGDPQDCLEHATNCKRLAEDADSPETKEHFLRLAKQWENLAAELEATKSLVETILAIGSPKRGSRRAG